jgi:hypothetical protein
MWCYFDGALPKLCPVTLPKIQDSPPWVLFGRKIGNLWKSSKLLDVMKPRDRKKKTNLFQTVPVWNPPNVYHGCSCNIWVSSNISSVLIFKLCPTFRLIKHRSRYYCRYLVDIVPKLCPLIVHKMMFFGVIYYVSYIRFH